MCHLHVYMYSPRFSLPHQCCYYNIIHNQPFFWHTVPMSLEKASYSYVLSILSYTVHNGTVYLSLYRYEILSPVWANKFFWLDVCWKTSRQVHLPTWHSSISAGKSSKILLFICCIMLRPSKEKDEPLKESVQNPRKTKRVKDISTADNGSRFPKLAYLTVEEFEEIPK